jgi:hypothetical protein
MPLLEQIDAVSTIEAPFFQQRHQRLHSKKHALHVNVEEVEVRRLGGLAQRVLFANTRVGKHCVQLIVAPLNRRLELIEISLARDIGNNRDRSIAKPGHCSLQGGC